MTEPKVKAKVLNQKYHLTPKHMASISPTTAELLNGCLQFDKKHRLRGETIAEHPAFNMVRDKVNHFMK